MVSFTQLRKFTVAQISDPIPENLKLFQESSNERVLKSLHYLLSPAFQSELSSSDEIISQNANDQQIAMIDNLWRYFNGVSYRKDKPPQEFSKLQTLADFTASGGMDAVLRLYLDLTKTDPDADSHAGHLASHLLLVVLEAGNEEENQANVDITANNQEYVTGE